MSGFFALLDDIATLAKLTLSTVDDTASMAVKTSAKVSAAAVDDVATTPQYVTGITPDRELPIIKKITLGSLRNKLLIILPIGLLLTAVAPWLLPVALVIGGAYLCFEGGEKILERFGGAAHAKEETGPINEAQIIRQAITTDFVLSTEIMLLALAEVEGESSMRRIIVLVLIALLITFAVYGLVAALIKLDGRRRAPGRTGPHRRHPLDGPRDRDVCAGPLPRHRDRRDRGDAVGGRPHPGGQPRQGRFPPAAPRHRVGRGTHPQPGPVLDHRNSHVLPHRSRHRHPAGPGLAARASRSDPPSQRLTINVPVCFTA